MSRTIRYRQIADDLRARLDAGEWAAGQVLPSEAELSRTHDASRVTVRRALEVLRDEHRVASRQGFGWYVPADPLQQSLARLGTVDDQLAADHRRSDRHICGFAFVAAPPDVAAALGVSTVLEVRRRQLADGRPFARITVWCPEELGAGLSRRQVQEAPFHQLLDLDWGDATQTIGAQAAGDDDAELLDIPVGSPVLVCSRVTRTVDHTPVLVSEHVFPAHLTEFVVELPNQGASIEPRGLRLVE